MSMCASLGSTDHLGIEEAVGSATVRGMVKRKAVKRVKSLSPFCRRLAEALKQKGISQTELAKLVGISRQSVGAVLKGDRQPGSYLGKLAKSLEVDPLWLTKEINAPVWAIAKNISEIPDRMMEYGRTRDKKEDIEDQLVSSFNAFVTGSTSLMAPYQIELTFPSFMQLCKIIGTLSKGKSVDPDSVDPVALKVIATELEGKIRGLEQLIPDEAEIAEIDEVLPLDLPPEKGKEFNDLLIKHAPQRALSILLASNPSILAHLNRPEAITDFVSRLKVLAKRK